MIEELRKEQEEDMESSLHHYDNYLIWRISKNQLLKKEMRWLNQQNDQSPVLQEERENEEMISRLKNEMNNEQRKKCLYDIVEVMACPR